MKCIQKNVMQKNISTARNDPLGKVEIQWKWKKFLIHFFIDKGNICKLLICQIILSTDLLSNDPKLPKIISKSKAVKQRHLKPNMSEINRKNIATSTY